MPPASRARASRVEWSACSSAASTSVEWATAAATEANASRRRASALERPGGLALVSMWCDRGRIVPRRLRRWRGPGDSRDLPAGERPGEKDGRFLRPQERKEQEA